MSCAAGSLSIQVAMINDKTGRSKSAGVETSLQYIVSDGGFEAARISLDVFRIELTCLFAL
jgi:hypothetical protein